VANEKDLHEFLFSEISEEIGLLEKVVIKQVGDPGKGLKIVVNVFELATDIFGETVEFGDVLVLGFEELFLEFFLKSDQMFGQLTDAFVQLHQFGDFLTLAGVRLFKDKYNCPKEYTIETPKHNS
jgi:hypothetical protein